MSYSGDLITLYQKKEFSQGLELCKRLTEEVSYEELTRKDNLLASNMAWFNPINEKVLLTSGKIIGILAWTRFDYSPTRALNGKCGAGSEYAVDEMASKLALLGNHVYVFTNIPTSPEGEDWRFCIPTRNPQYMPLKSENIQGYMGPKRRNFVRSFDELLEVLDYKLDELIVWRLYNFGDLPIDDTAKRVHFWSHDFTPCKEFSYNVNGVYCLSEYHKVFLENCLGKKYKYIVGCNGTSVDLQEPIRKRVGKEKFRVCYASNYVRGLYELLYIWRDVYRVVPEAELHIFYGRETWGCYTANQLEFVVRKIQSLEDCNVYERCKDSMMPHMQLLEEFKGMSILCYPYMGESETFSIVCAAAQQQGCLTVARKKHALLETCEAQTQNLIELDEIKEKLIEYLQTDEEILYPLRLKHREATLRFTWENAAKIWNDYFLHDDPRED